MLAKLWLFVPACTLVCACGEISVDKTPGPAGFAIANKQSLSIPSNRTLQGGDTDLTLAAWINLSSKPANEVVAAKDNNETKEGSEYWLGYEVSSDRLNFQVEDPVNGTMFVKANSFGSPPTDEWIFVVGWFDRSNQIVNIQINNGPIDQAAAGTTTRITDTPFAIGSDANVGSYFDGQISSVAFFKRTLSDEERTFLYSPAGVPQVSTYDQLGESLQQEPTSTFVSWWNLTETTGPRHDSRSTGNDLSPTDAQYDG